MNIHFVNNERVPTATFRRTKGIKGPSKTGTQPPRTRSGKEYPGGKRLRTALKLLGMRQSAREATISGKSKKIINPTAYQKPGSMKGRS